MRHGNVLFSGSGGHSNADSTTCHGCGHPVRIHNDFAGCVKAECYCAILRAELTGGPDAEPPAAAPVEPAEAGPAPAEDPAAVETPRLIEPRPAVPVALVDPAVVGGGDADEEVAAADPVATGTAVTSLDSLAGFVEQLFATAYYVAPRWYCPSCHDWPLDPGLCRACKKRQLQAVYLATVPREIAL